MSAGLPLWRRLQLPNTAAVLAALLLLPSAALLIWPRPQAVGLGRIMVQSQLMQSFAVAPASPPPALWQQRLGAVAPALWTRQVGVWWQFWGAHSDAGAYLVLPAASLPPRERARLPQQPLLVDDLAVLAADPLSRQLLAERLRSVGHSPRGLDQRCLDLLRRPQAVVWSSGGLAALSGPLAPLLQRLQQGCLHLELRGTELAFSGEAALGSGVLAPSPQTSWPAWSSRPLPPGLLLELRGPSLDALLQGLLSRQLVREPLAARYGITEPQLALLRQLPFVLRLRELPQGPFQAALELELDPTPRNRPAWARLLQGLREPLRQQGLQEPPEQLQPPGPRLVSSLLPSARWSDERGTVVGGWLWRFAPGGREPRLVLHLGPPPPVALQPEQPAPAMLLLRARPADLQRLALFPNGFPALVRQARGLDLVVGDGARAPLSPLRGRLELSRSR